MSKPGNTIRTAVLAGLVVTAAATIAGCDGKSGSPARPGHDHRGAAGGHSHGGDSIAVLRYGKRAQIFVEYPAPVAGRAMTFTAHFTRLGDRFVPVRRGRLVVRFSVRAGILAQMTAARPARTGIFLPTGRAPAAGEYTLSFALDAPDATESFAWKVRVYPSAAAAAKRKRAPQPVEQAIGFLMEQQWVIPFATAPAERREFRDGVEVPATVHARPGAHARLTAPVAGIVRDVAKGLRMGARVKAGQTLATVEPLLLKSVDLPQLQLAAVQAQQALKLAKLRRDRLRAMLRARAVARLEVDRAEYEVQRQQAAASAAGSRLWLHQRSRQRSTATGHGVAIRAPFAGTVIGRSLAPGAAVQAGDRLVEIVDLAKLRAVAHVPALDLARARRARDASLRLRRGRWVPLGGSPEVGVRVDPRHRSVPFAYALPSAAAQLPLGAWTRVRLLGPPRQAVAVPEDAVLDDDGEAVVLVQTDGESFARRRVDVGPRDRGWVEVRQGVRAGDRVVTRGGYQMLLGAKLRGSASVGHGHAH